MSGQSTIEWTDATWNPVVGCTKVSPGCDHCYAVRMSLRQAGAASAALGRGRNPGQRRYYLDVVSDGDWNDEIRQVPEALTDPLTWARARMVFVNSMSDLFHKNAPEDFTEKVCRVMERANWHTYQILTKRSSLMRNLLRGRLRFAADLTYAWWGVSVEDRAHGLPRIEHLRETPAAVRFLSIEPLLEDLGEINLDGIGWVIVGGESGPGARPMKPEWVRSIRDQCASAKVPFFFKQWGGVRKGKTGRMLDGQTHDAMPQRLARLVPSLKERRAWIAELTQAHGRGWSWTRSWSIGSSRGGKSRGITVGVNESSVILDPHSGSTSSDLLRKFFEDDSEDFMDGAGI